MCCNVIHDSSSALFFENSIPLDMAEATDFGKSKLNKFANYICRLLSFRELDLLEEGFL